MGGFNPRKTERMEATIADLTEFAGYLEKSNQEKESQAVRQALDVLRTELEKMSRG